MNFFGEILGICDSIIKEAKAIKDYTLRLNETQSDAMRRIYTDNRFDELPHIQNLVVALTQMLNGEEPDAAAQMDEGGDGEEGGDDGG